MNKLYDVNLVVPRRYKAVNTISVNVIAYEDNLNPEQALILYWSYIDQKWHDPQNNFTDEELAEFVFWTYIPQFEIRPTEKPVRIIDGE